MFPCRIQALMLEPFYHDTPKDEGTSFIQWADSAPPQLPPPPALPVGH